MIGARTLLAAYALDLAIGDPASLPHPVRAIGRFIERGEPWFRRRFPRTPLGEFASGGSLACSVIGASAACAALALALARRCDARLGSLLTVILAHTTLATRNLLDEVGAVADALERKDLAMARVRLSRVVGRDTAALDEAEIARAAIETLAESLCDGVIAPLCALVAGGVPGAIAFKAVSTLDSMIGHIEPPYTFFGRFAARLDDCANLLPARLSALLLLGMHPSKRAWRIWRRDARAHRSPNAGHSEAAMAGILGVRLGGRNFYDGISHSVPFLGAELPTPRTPDIRAALRLTFQASLAGAALAALTLAARARRGGSR